MLDSISPYALLRASMPKPAPTVVTAYDLFSTAQQATAAHASAPQPPPAAQPSAQDTVPSAAVRLLPERRTHYIADIKTRHSAALRHAALHNQPLS